MKNVVQSVESFSAKRKSTTVRDDVVHQMNRVSLPRSRALERLTKLDHSAWQVHIDAMARKRAGESIIALSIGDPDFATPDYILASVNESLNNERTHYTHPAGEMVLRQTLAQIESESSAKTLDVEQFTIFNGATAAIYSVLTAIGSEGDNIVTCQPTYLGYEPTFMCVGVELKAIATKSPHFRFDVEGVVDAIDDNTIGVLVNSPSNPVGNIVSEHELRQLYEICSERNIWLISDEVYSELYYEQEHVSLANVVEDFRNVVVVDSLSKSHAMSGWRVGWTLTNRELSEHLQNIALSVFFSGCAFIHDAAATALSAHTHDVASMRQEYQNRRDYTMERISRIPSISAETPAAGMFVMVNVHQNSDTFARRLLDETGVSVVPGTPSGTVVKEYVRVGLTQPISQLEEAWNRIERWLKGRNT